MDMVYEPVVLCINLIMIFFTDSVHDMVSVCLSVCLSVSVSLSLYAQAHIHRCSTRLQWNSSATSMRNYRGILLSLQR